ncbi:MAG: glutamyl-tRNA reductase, partial [Desulfuromusa sp.]|nr:glutamyl-tRNA reductase [Desulfuromusa sp.]
MNIVIVGLSHKTAPVEIREKVAFPPTAMEAPLQQVLELPSVSEAMIVSTCNRVELYAISPQSDVACIEMRQFLADFHD